MMTFQNDLLCFSHLRWTFVFQRPQHLMSRFARYSRVYFIEEPVFTGDAAYLQKSICERTGVRVITPTLPVNTSDAQSAVSLQTLLRELLKKEAIHDYAAWYYTPMALEFTSELEPIVTVYDCMDELSNFSNAPAALLQNEQRLFDKADLVFTGGSSLFEAKRGKHPHVYLFPSSVDAAHFAQALTLTDEPDDQRSLPRPRIGYVGVIDERMDLGLLEYLAAQRPEWQIVLIGPVVKIDPQTLPRQNNIHYLGMKSYDQLPAYLSGWNVALLPFAQNDATRFISPTKTPEYLAAGLPVVSTPIRDVVRPYGELGLVCIGHNPQDFLQCVEKQLREERSAAWKAEVEVLLSSQSWDKTWDAMQRLLNKHIALANGAVAARPATDTRTVRTPASGPQQSLT